MVTGVILVIKDAARINGRSVDTGTELTPWLHAAVKLAWRSGQRTGVYTDYVSQWSLRSGCEFYRQRGLFPLGMYDGCTRP